MRKSSRKSHDQILGVISAKRAEKMLADWANAQDDWPYLLRLYPEIAGTSDAAATLLDPSSGREKGVSPIAHIQRYLRKAWDTRDLRSFEWYAWKAQVDYARATAYAKHHVPTGAKLYEEYKSLHSKEESEKWMHEFIERMNSAAEEADKPPTVVLPVEAAIFYFRRNHDRALRCPNPECAGPYFFRSKKGQKFCSPEGATPSRQESKRRWWANNPDKHRKGKH